MQLYKLCIILIILSSCNTGYYLIKKNQPIEDFTINLFVAADFNRVKKPLIQVELYANNLKYYYRFFSNRVERGDFRLTKKESKKEGNAIYKSVFDNSYSIAFTHLDSVIFNKVIEVSDSLGKNEFKYLSRISGFTLDDVIK